LHRHRHGIILQGKGCHWVNLSFLALSFAIVVGDVWLAEDGADSASRAICALLGSALSFMTIIKTRRRSRTRPNGRDAEGPGQDAFSTGVLMHLEVRLCEPKPIVGIV
jgi:hypothetical protein